MILTDAFGTARKKGGGGNASLDRGAIHALLHDMTRKPGKSGAWEARHGASVMPFVWRRSQGLDGVAATAAYRAFSFLPSHSLEL